MKNKMVTPLRTTFFTNEKVVSQCNNQNLGFSVEMLVTHFDQEKFEQLLIMGNTNSLCVSKHRKISIVKAPLVNSRSESLLRLKQAQSELNAASNEAKQAPR